MILPVGVACAGRPSVPGGPGAAASGGAEAHLSDAQGGGARHVPEASAASPLGDPWRIVGEYDAYLESAIERISTLTVDQEMIEPQQDGSTKRALAVLHYSPEAGMVRREISSEISYPRGNFTLGSLLGPAIRPDEYEVRLEGTEEMEGFDCYRLELKALRRDAHHVDGMFWVSVDGCRPVRIAGKVSDPPFPVTEITLDKSFAPSPEGIWLLRRHSGEVEAWLLVGKKRGLRHIFYDGYILNGQPLGGGAVGTE